MKLVLSIIVLFGFGFLGFGIRKVLQDRVVFFSELKRFVDQFAINISFLQDNLYEYIGQFNSSSAEFSSILKEFTSCKRDLNLIVDSPKTKFTTIKAEECQMVWLFLNGIGKMDADSELSKLKAFDIKVQEKLEEAKLISSKYATLTVKLSVLLGALVVLILI